MHKSIIFLLGLLTILIPVGSSMSNSKALAFDDYGYEADQYKNYAMDMANNNYYKSQGSDIIKKIKCNNINSNNNGVDVNLGIQNNDALVEAQAEDEGEIAASGSDGRQSGSDTNSRFVCINNNDNIVIGGEEPVPPTPPTPPATGSLTVNKEIFGCIDDNNMDNVMDCPTLRNDSPLWLPCTDPTISNTPFCQNLPPNLFDIEVLGEIQQFEGSTAGTTIQDFQTDTFIVNEIVHESSLNQLGGSFFETRFCIEQGFAGGGQLQNLNTQTIYQLICFEYEDEQGNDCSTVTLAAGEEKTCTVKNYILQAFDQSQSIITQGIGDSPESKALEKQQPNDSPELTATEKTTKLKQQWLDLLP